MEKDFDPIIEPSVYCKEALPSRVSILNQVMDALKDPGFKKIGIYGIGGVGKTTLAKEVHRKAIEDKLFDSVVMVDVSQTPDLGRIKGEIANLMGLEFYVSDVPEWRAIRSLATLTYPKVLFILDDIRTKLDLKSIGIPSDDDFKRCKILLTSRRNDVLSYEMGTQKDFSLEVLHEDEARSLFEMTVGATKDPELRAISKEIVQKCAGLPLLIVTVATYLKSKKLNAWRVTLKKLSDFGNEELHEKLHEVLKIIYESLPSNEVKSFFLLCALFGESNIPTNHLLTYGMGLGLFRNIIKVQDARDRLFRMIEKLKIESLLLDRDMNGYVKMHEVVQDVALLIATRAQHAFYGISGHGLREWPTKDCNRIALPYCDIDVLPQSLECPKVELFSLFSKDLYLEIPDLFFEGFRELKVLNLTSIRFMSLPSSFHFLTNLNSLYLHQCELKDVAIIGELKQLQFLSFANSCIVKLPKQIKQLNQLKLLDLTNCTELKVFPANVLSKLSLLEELYMGNSFVEWDMVGNISVMELDELRHLTTLEIQVIDDNKLPNCLFSRGLQRYRICIGNGLYWGEEHGSSRWLKLRLKASIHMEHGLKKLLRGTEALYLYEVGGIEKWLYNLDGKVSRLKHLHIQEDDLIQYIINSTMQGFCHTCPTLETLSLRSLNSLEEICHGQLANGSLGKLRILKVSSCDKLRNLFSYSSAKCLSQLQEMEVDWCDNIEAIIGKESEDEVMEFTQLSSLKLTYLSQLTSVFCGQISFPNLTSLIVSECGSLKYIFKTSMVKSLLQLKRLVIQSCDFVEEIIFKEESINKIIFLNMNFLHLDNLPNLKRFSNSYPIEFQSLEEMEIMHCQKLKNIVSNISNRGNICGIQSLFNDMVTFPNLQIMRVSNMENLEHIWDSQLIIDSLYKLKLLTISSCRNLLAMFSSNVVRSFQRLDDQQLSYCHTIEEIYQLGELNSIEVAPFELRHFKIAPSLVSFQNLTTLHVAYCDKLENLVASSTAKTMVHLMDLRITYSEMMKYIVTNDDREHEIIFNCLKCLELRYLPTLYSFCSGNYVYHFPLLEDIIVENCLRMKIFCSGVLRTPKLQGVRHWKYNSNGKYEKEVQYWDGNLNATIASQCFKERVLQNADKWYMIEDSSSLKAILSNQLQFLHMLKKINVSDCDSIQVVFDLEDISVERGHASLLQKLEELQLINLPKLSKLWNKDPVRMFDFKKLRLLKVQNCSSLKYVFTQSMASSLVELQEIEVENCKMMEAIIKEEEAEQTGLPKMKFLSLKKISIKCCPRVKEFMSPVLSGEQNLSPDEEGIREQIIRKQELYEIAVPMLKELRIDWNIIKHKLKGNNQPDFFTTLDVIELIFPSNGFPTMDKLVLSDSLVKEIIIFVLDIHHELLPMLRKIVLSKLPNLEHVVYDNDPRRVSVFQNLQVLKVWECHKLEILVPSSVSFQNLTFLQVSTCDGLINLLTVSTAKSLMQLKIMYVGRCKRLQEIIELELNGEEGEIGFSHLEYLVLDDLPCLISFCSSYKTSFDFPCLEEVFVIKCPKLKTFAQAIKTPKLSRVQTGGKEYEWEWEGNLNNTIQTLSMERKYRTRRRSENLKRTSA